MISTVGQHKKLERVLAEREAIAHAVNPECPNCCARADVAAMRRTLDVLNGKARERAQENGSATLKRAIEIESERVGYRDRPSKVREQRARTAALLDHFDENEPRP